MSLENDVNTITTAMAAAAVAATSPDITPSADKNVHILGVIGGSSLFHAKEFSAALEEKVVETEYGGVVVHVGRWKSSSMQVVFIQRHHADPDLEYKQPRKINFKAIATALKQLKCDAVIGVYSVGSMNRTLHVGRFVVPEDYFNPFDILHMSRHYDAHIVPDVTTELREELVKILDDGNFNPHDGGVYVQTAGPRFETKAEVRFFAQFGVRMLSVGIYLLLLLFLIVMLFLFFYCIGSHWHDWCERSRAHERAAHALRHVWTHRQHGQRPGREADGTNCFLLPSFSGKREHG